MRSGFKALLTVGLVGIAAALAARQAFQPVAPPPAASAAPPAGATPAAPAQATTLGAGAPSAAGEVEPLPADAPLVDAEEGLRLGGWLRTHLPMCGRDADVPLRTAPGGGATDQALPSCETAYGEFPQVTLLPVGPRRGDWVRVGKGWARVDEVRSAEVVVVDGREYWHDLFNATAEQVDGRKIVLKGDTDPCAGEVCGSQNALIEQGEAVRARYEAEYPGSMPAPIVRQMEQEIEALNVATEKEWADQRKTLDHRPREERTLRLPGPSAGKPKVGVEGGGYLCCT
jgi:hypothetical protein